MSSHTFSYTGMLPAYHLSFASVIPFSICDKALVVMFCRGEESLFLIVLLLTHGGLVGCSTDCHHTLSNTYPPRPYPYRPRATVLQGARVISS